MSKLRDKLDSLDKDKIKEKWEDLDSKKGLSTRDKLEKLVNQSLKRDKFPKGNESKNSKRTKKIDSSQNISNEFILCNFSYPLTSIFGKFALNEWKTISNYQLSVVFGVKNVEEVSAMKLLFFDTETTGLSGGTGVIPFMLGFGFFEGDSFQVRIFILNDLNKEDVFLSEIDRFLENHDFCATITYNGKSFDFPLMETRYILQRKRFPLMKLPHLDFLFPARTIWKNTFESRKLGYLGDILLGISRDDDVDASRIPSMYFNYLRSGSFSIIEKVVEHNALDLVGLAALVLLALKYQQDIVFTRDEGEILGVAKLYEKYGDFDKANELYEILRQTAIREDIVSVAVKSQSIIKKKKKLYKEALELWDILSKSGSVDRLIMKELSIHFEHREKNYVKALEYVQKGLEVFDLTNAQQKDFEKRLNRLRKKIETVEQ